jgi:NitT/TauT family transport system substrate-binding protein
MTIHRRSFLKLGTAVASAGLGIGAPAVLRAATPVKMTLPWLPLGTFSYAFVANKMGFWEKRGLEVTIDRGFGSGRVCVPVDQGQYDFGILDLAVMMNCAARGLDLVAVAGIWPRSPVGIFSLKEYGITKPQDLEGQTVAFDVGSGDFQLWPAFIKATGIDDKKVNKVTMDAAALIKALVERQVKAEGNFFGSIAPSLWAQGLEINSMLYEDYGVKMFSNVVACKRGTIEKKPDLCEAFVGRPDGRAEIRLFESGKIRRAAPRERQGVPRRQRRQPEGDRVRASGEHRARRRTRGAATRARLHGSRSRRHHRQDGRDLYGREECPADRDALYQQVVGAVKLTEAEWT